MHRSQQINNCVISSLGRMTTLQSLKLSDTKVVADTVDLRALWTLTQLKELSFAIRRGRLSGQPMQVDTKSQLNLIIRLAVSAQAWPNFCARKGNLCAVKPLPV